MSDEAEDRDGTAEEVTEQDEQQAAAWSEPAAGPRWSEIASEAELGTPGQADAGSGAAPEPPADPAPVTEAGRSRRPSSLRSGPLPVDVPRRVSTGNPGPPKSDAGSSSPVSEPASPGKSGQMSSAAGSLLDKGPAKKLQAFVKERPEAGLGIAFISGLLIATIVRRLAR